jgi:CDP-glucose 4,6-dehydratase
VAALVSPSPESTVWTNRPVLVTGATGLLGSWLVRELQARGAAVVALVRDQVPQSHLWTAADLDRLVSVHGALEDYEVVSRAINEYEIDTVMHLGAQTIVPIANRNPLSTFEANIRGTWHVLEACRTAPTVKAVVLASSDKAYGNHDELPYDESTALIGSHPYDVSKSCADLIAFAYHRTWGLPVCVTRCGNLFGPGDLNFNRIVPGTIRSALMGEPPVIRSDGSFVRDYFYVRDAALAYVQLAEHMFATGLAGEAFNFSNEVQLTVVELVERILALIDPSLAPVILGGGAGEIERQYLSAAKARKVLGWTPAYSLEQGLHDTIAWYQALVDRRAPAARAPEPTPITEL